MTPALITWLAILAFILGFIAILLEIFAFPGFGIAGILGIVFFGWGILLLSVDITQVTGALVMALTATIVVIFVGIRLMSRYKMWYMLTLQNKQKNEEGYVAPPPGLKDFTGKEGIALTPLRPSGAALIDGQRLDVVTSGEFIKTGSRIMVLKVEGTRVIVREMLD